MRALLSVSDKTGLHDFAQGLSALGVELVATSGTAASLGQSGLPVRTIAEVTGFPELLGGDVKTLHPAVHAAILARRDDERHVAELRERDLTPIDLVVCTLSPLADLMAGATADLAAALDAIDVGGAALVRAAAKNYPHVTVVVRPEDYAMVLAELSAAGATRLETRRRLAAIAFQHTAFYDTLIAEYLRRDAGFDLFPDELTLGMRRLRTLRYGENPHQQSALYVWSGMAPALAEESGPAGNGAGARRSGHATLPTVAGAKVLQGKELSFNNLLDLDTALACVASFKAPAAVVVKHTNPCGLACGDTLVESYRRAHAGDPVAAYGGVVGFNREVDEETAADVAQIFYEAVIAPGYSDAALAILGGKHDLRLLATGAPIGPVALATEAHDPRRLDLRSISGGVLAQTADLFSEQDIQRQVVTEREPTLEEVTDLLFAWKVVQHVKSNAIVLARKLSVVGVGAGQVARVYSVQIAVDRAADRARGSVLASDADFPFPDGIEAAAKAGVTAIIQPGGSKRDSEAIRMANRYGMAMVFTGQRHFRH